MDDRRDVVDHRRRGDVEAIFNVTLAIAWRCCEFSHDNDQIFLYGQDFVGNEFVGCNGPSQTKRSSQLIDTAVSINACIALRHAMAVHEGRFAFIARFGDDRHQANCRAFL